jgi:hypothetical protein
MDAVSALTPGLFIASEIQKIGKQNVGPAGPVQEKSFTLPAEPPVEKKNITPGPTSGEKMYTAPGGRAKEKIYFPPGSPSKGKMYTGPGAPVPEEPSPPPPEDPPPSEGPVLGDLVPCGQEESNSFMKGLESEYSVNSKEPNSISTSEFVISNLVSNGYLKTRIMSAGDYLIDLMT